MTTIKTIDDERWVNCPTVIDEHEHLWVDETVLE